MNISADLDHRLVEMISVVGGGGGGGFFLLFFSVFSSVFFCCFSFFSPLLCCLIASLCRWMLDLYNCLRILNNHIVITFSNITL